VCDRTVRSHPTPATQNMTAVFKSRHRTKLLVKLGIEDLVSMVVPGLQSQQTENKEVRGRPQPKARKKQAHRISGLKKSPVSREASGMIPNEKVTAYDKKDASK